MRHKLLHRSGGERTFALILETGEEALECLKQFATEQQVFAAQLTAIGAFRRVTLKYFDWDRKKYLSIPFEEQVEVATLVGDIAQAPSGEPSVHVHVVVGRRDGTAMAGHLGEGSVRPTLEVIITESPAHVRKAKDPETGLALIEL